MTAQKPNYSRTAMYEPKHCNAHNNKQVWELRVLYAAHSMLKNYGYQLI